MNYFEKLLTYPANIAIEKLWFCKSDDSNSNLITFPFLNEALVINNSDYYKSKSQNGNILMDKSGCWVSGMQTKPFQTLVSGKHEECGILFKPGGFFRLFGIPATEFSNQFISAKDFNSPKLNEIIELLSLENPPSKKLFLLENFIKSKLNLEKINPYLENTISVLNEKGLRSGGIKKITTEINQSSKSYIKNFKKVFGLTPKKYCHNLLINNSLVDIISNPSKKLSDIVYDNGFYDHSHFNKHFVSLLGITPKEYKNYFAKGKITKEFPNYLEL